MADLLIKNGTIVTPQSVFQAGIAVEKGRIIAIGKESALPEAKESLDAKGLHVLPGLIDDHVHFREPGLTYKEDFATGSKAAAAGGVTTIMDMPNTLPPTAGVGELREKIRLAEGKSHVDFGVYAVITSENLDDIEALAKAGAAGFKLFMGETTGYIRCPDDGYLYEAFRKVRRTGLRVGAHAENDAILQRIKSRLMAEGRTDSRAHLESRPAFAELEAISRGILLSEETEIPFHIFHLSTREGLEQVVRAKHRGSSVSAEVLVSHLLLDDSHYAKLGNLIRLNPPIRTPEHQTALWEGIQRGWIDNIATDHAPHGTEEKLADNVWDAACGFIGVETALPLMLTQVIAGRLDLKRYVQLTSENPARLWGYYPRKGVIQVGSDADLVLVDLKKKGRIESAHLHSKNPVTPFDGWKIQGIPQYTLLRGRVIMADGEIVGTPWGEPVKPGNTV